MRLIFQYGSNCMTARLNGPNRLNGDAEDLDRAQSTEDYDITFDVFSKTNGCAAADLIPLPNRKVWGVLYRVSEKGFERLKAIEGPRYEPKPIRIRNRAGEELEATTFLVKPNERRTSLATSAAYVSWIIYGLRDHGVPEEYIAHVAEVAIETNQRACASAAEQIRLIKTL